MRFRASGLNRGWGKFRHLRSWGEVLVTVSFFGSRYGRVGSDAHL